jgi:hypothetical protein
MPKLRQGLLLPVLMAACILHCHVPPASAQGSKAEVQKESEAKAWRLLKANANAMLSLKAYSAECRTITTRTLILEGQAPV